jgi:S1-C subfamily serine protease
VSRDQMAAQDMVSRSGQMGVPVIIVDDQVVVGFNQPRLETLLAGRSETRPKPFGLRIADASKISQQSGGVPVFGAYVGGVAPGSPAERAGLRAGDVVTELNMRPIRNAADLEQAIRQLQPGGHVQISFLRGGQNMVGETAL